MRLSVTSGIRVSSFSLEPLFQMYLGVSLLLVASGKFATALITTEWFLASVGTHVSREMIASRERSHADTALKWLLSGVYAYVSRELVAPRKSSIATIDGTGVGALVHGSFAWPVWIFSRFYWNKPER